MANWHADASRHIARRFVVMGKLVLDTPAAFGSGETQGTELVILTDAVEHSPLLPGASLAGALRQHLLERQNGYRAADTSSHDNKTYATLLFGEALDDQTVRMESRVIVHDALGHGHLTWREGVKIAGETRTADDGMLFTTQVWEAGTTFDLRMELLLYDGDPNTLIEGFAATLNALGSGAIPMGGRKGRGYGRVHVEDWHISFYDMAQSGALAAWMCDEPTDNHRDDFFAMSERFIDRRHYVRVEATLNLCDSLLIRDVSDVADNEHLTSNGDPILSGTSLAGSLRARAIRIVNTISPTSGATLVEDLFGKHGADGESDDLTASRLRVEEHPIENGIFDRIQNRVKIDRFTGGAFETALFDERPVFAGDDTQVKVYLELHYPADTDKHRELDAQTGLLLVLLKDLWTEDLPLGGEASIGRGRLHGKSAKLLFKVANADKPNEIRLDANGVIKPTDAATLQGYVDTLWAYLKEERDHATAID
jgi:CRISPR/Cas system CSM-associated protein Csm3 (group 7 of RAMP superfamily)